jgi:2-alkyl-3-oxoalkanoate reductase
MRVLIAGATGAIGIPLVRALLAAGHQVTGLARMPVADHAWVVGAELLTCGCQEFGSPHATCAYS